MRPSYRARLARAAALPMLVISLLLGPATVAQAADEVVATSTFTVLATEGGTPSGPDPRGPNEADNEFKPADYESNFLWGAAVGLGVLVLGLVGLLGLLYRLMVQRPAQAADNKG